MNPRRPHTSFTAAFVNRPHARTQRLVRGFARRALTGAPRVVPARGDSEHSGHRGDSKLGLIRSHEPVDLPGTVPRANQAVAFAKISRSSRRRRISRRRRRSSSRSAVLGPSPRRPSSRSACTTQLRIACAVGSTLVTTLPDSVRLAPTQSSGAGTPARTAVLISPWWIPPPQRVRCPPIRINSRSKLRRETPTQVPKRCRGESHRAPVCSDKDFLHLSTC